MVSAGPHRRQGAILATRDRLVAPIVAARAAVHNSDPWGGATCLIAAVGVTYLGVKGGGYDTTIWGSAGVIVCWAVLLVAIVGLDFARTPTPTGWLMIGALIALVAWSAVGLIWSGSDERTLAAVAREATYLGVLVLAIGGLRARHARHLLAGIALAIAAIAAIALLSRMRPNLFSQNPTNTLLPGARSRLSFPLNYWNALAELIAIGIPLVWSMATQARTALRQALMAALLPLLILALALTLSRGGLLALALASLTYLILAPNRGFQIVTGLVGAGGGAALTSAAFHDHALRQGLTTAVARHQGNTLLIMTVIVCGAVGAIQFALSVARRRGAFARLRPVAHPGRAIRRHPRAAAAVLLIALVVAFIGAGGPHQLSHAWTVFKSPSVANNLSPARIGSLSGNGRYQFWRASIAAMEQDPLHGIGAGTWEFWWTRHGDLAAGYAQNAHSLLFETLAETGLPGGVLIVLFLGAALAGSVRRARRTAPADRAWFAATAASCIAFAVAALTDWVWQVPVVPVCFLALAGLALGDDRPLFRTVGIVRRLAIMVPAAACLVTIAIPLGVTVAIQDSQNAVAHGSIEMGLRYARTAERIEPWGASGWMQEALVFEFGGDLRGAAQAALRAEANEPLNWRPPLILARVEAEQGRTARAVRAARRALLLNPSLATLLR